MKHADTNKEALNKLRQKYWIYRSRHYDSNIICRSLTCRKLHCKLYNYLKTPSLTKLRLVDTQPFSTTGVNNFCPSYLRNVSANRFSEVLDFLLADADARTTLVILKVKKKHVILL